jgi:PAS domain-containing protein
MNGRDEADTMVVSDPRTPEERLRSIIEQIPAVAYVAATDSASTTLFVSPQIEELLGVSPADFLANRAPPSPQYAEAAKALVHPEPGHRLQGLRRSLRTAES